MQHPLAREYAARRKTIMQQTGSSAITLLEAAPVAHRNHYHEFAYRQNSDFYYLTGFNEPEAILVLCPERAAGETILFCRTRSPEEEVWTGYRAGLEGAREIYGADQAFPIETFADKLAELLAGRQKIFYPTGTDRSLDDLLFTTVDSLRMKIRNGVHFPRIFADIRPVLHEMRITKSTQEISLMRRAAEISARGHIRAMQYCRPGLHEYALEAELTHEFVKHGARAHAYTPIVGSGANSCILHYISNDQPIADGALVLIDAGAELENYASDVTRTFPANGRFSAEQRAVYEVVLAAQQTGIELLKPGSEWDVIEESVTRKLVEGLQSLGLLKGSIDELLETRAYLPFYMHRCGHWLGLDTHDAGHYRMEDGTWRKLAPGMVRTMEPGLYISASIPGVPARWHNIGIRIEDDVLITENGNEVLSRGVTKEIDEIEELMRN